jgi:CemA family
MLSIESILLVTNLGIGFHSTNGWELLIGSVYKDFGLTSGLVSTFQLLYLRYPCQLIKNNKNVILIFYNSYADGPNPL